MNNKWSKEPANGLIIKQIEHEASFKRKPKMTRKCSKRFPNWTKPNQKINSYSQNKKSKQQNIPLKCHPLIIRKVLQKNRKSLVAVCSRFQISKRFVNFWKDLKIADSFLSIDVLIWSAKLYSRELKCLFIEVKTWKFWIVPKPSV